MPLVCGALAVVRGMDLDLKGIVLCEVGGSHKAGPRRPEPSDGQREGVVHLPERQHGGVLAELVRGSPAAHLSEKRGIQKLAWWRGCWPLHTLTELHRLRLQPLQVLLASGVGVPALDGHNGLTDQAYLPKVVVDGRGVLDLLRLARLEPGVPPLSAEVDAFLRGNAGGRELPGRLRGLPRPLRRRHLYIHWQRHCVRLRPLPRASLLSRNIVPHPLDGHHCSGLFRVLLVVARIAGEAAASQRVED
mmetsp:Transcript_30365/g.69995  ORF Transcript_30365/g.69995 Transcript_30365/m.69995 type:complete len:247 (+) Transcript_30365:80-820(+)